MAAYYNGYRWASYLPVIMATERSPYLLIIMAIEVPHYQPIIKAGERPPFCLL
jgi:hypothetical protein